MDRAHEPLRPVLSRAGRKKRDLELEVGSRAHFEDAAYYDATYRSRVDDVAFYVRAASKHDAVLEYGIGNGRIALPIARQGTEVVGVDHSSPMLADLRAKLRREPEDVRARVTARRGDMRRVKLGRRFDLVTCPFNTALHLYERTDVERWLARVSEHLTPRGELLLDVTMPVLEDLARDPSVPYRTPKFRHPRLGTVNYREYFDYDRVRQILFVSMCFEREKKTKHAIDEGDSSMTPLAHRQFFPEELSALLHYNGFDVVERMGDFEGGPLVATSDVIVVRAKKRRR